MPLALPMLGAGDELHHTVFVGCGPLAHDKRQPQAETVQWRLFSAAPKHFPAIGQGELIELVSCRLYREGKRKVFVLCIGSIAEGAVKTSQL